MPEQLLIGGKDTLSGASDTGFIGLMGPWGEAFNATETKRRAPITGAGTLKNFLVNVGTNTHSTNSVATVRINAADGNLTVTITAATTGVFEDTSNTDAVVADDFLGVNLVPGTGGTIELGIIQTILDATTFVPLHVTPNFWNPLSSPVYGSIMASKALSTTEADVEYPLTTDVTFSNLRLFIDANSQADTTTFTIRINGADGNQTVSVAAATTGDFEDSSNTDAVVDGDVVNVKIVTVGAPGGLSTTVIQFVMDQDLIYLAKSNTSFSSPATRFGGLIGVSPTPRSSVSADIKVVAAGANFSLRNLVVHLTANNGTSGSSEFSVQVNDADSGLLLTVALGLTGLFQDTDTIAVTTDDTLHLKMVHSGSANHAITIRLVGLEGTYIPTARTVIATVWIIPRVEK